MRAQRTRINPKRTQNILSFVRSFDGRAMVVVSGFWARNGRKRFVCIALRVSISLFLFDICSLFIGIRFCIELSFRFLEPIPECTQCSYNNMWWHNRFVAHSVANARRRRKGIRRKERIRIRSAFAAIHLYVQCSIEFHTENMIAKVQTMGYKLELMMSFWI